MACLTNALYNRPSMKQNLSKLFLILTVFILAGSFIQPAHAQAGSAYDLIAEVNALRQSMGLEAYTIDSYLMSFAQSHSDYMASLGYWTHTRSDGSTAFQQGIEENVAMGTNMSTSYCVYTVWSDYIHWKTMVENASGSVGAGVAFAGSTVFYTLNIISGGEVAVPVNVVADPQQAAAPQQQVEDTPDDYINLIITSTPNPDGSVIHYVKYGESLWSIAIAYGTTGEQIMLNTGNAGSTTDVYEGQRLIIFPPQVREPTPTPSKTPIPPTRTSTPQRPTRTPLPTETPMPTAESTPPPPLLYRAFADSRSVAVSLISISGLGLILLLWFGFLKKPDKKN